MPVLLIVLVCFTGLLVIALIIMLCLRNKQRTEVMGQIDGQPRYVFVYEKPASAWYIPVLVFQFILIGVLPALGFMRLGKALAPIFSVSVGMLVSLFQILSQKLSKRAMSLLLSDGGVNMFSKSGEKWIPVYKESWSQLEGFLLTKRGFQFKAKREKRKLSPPFIYLPEQGVSIGSALKLFECRCLKHDVVA